jgi:hypothetical protein
MSILVVEVLPDGIIFGADRNITITERPTPKFNDGWKEASIVITHGQSQRPKVLKWPNKKALVGYIGEAEIGGMPTDEWLYEYIGNNMEFSSFEALANDLADKVQTQLCTDRDTRLGEPGHLLIHLAGFEKRESEYVPVVWTIRNDSRFEDGKYLDIKEEFERGESFWPTYGGCSPKEIRGMLRERVSNHKPCWFHQGEGLLIFNTFENSLRVAFASLSHVRPEDFVPKTLQEWQQQVKMAVLTYGAYFQAFKGPGEQYVGGGADTVWLDWP